MIYCTNVVPNTFISFFSFIVDYFLSFVFIRLFVLFPGQSTCTYVVSCGSFIVYKCLWLSVFVFYPEKASHLQTLSIDSRLLAFKA